MMKRMMIAVWLVWLSSGSVSFAAGDTQAKASPRLFIDIVAVTQFSDKKYTELSEGLTDAYSEVADSLERLFQASQPGAVIRVRKLAEETSHRAIQHLLYEEMAARENSVNLLFILTHGHLEHFPGSLAARSDVFLAASDTVLANVRGTGIPAAALLAAVTHFPASSSTFIFIDACHSGAAANLVVSLNKSLWDHLGVNLMLLVSSGAYERSFNALFTRALIAQWSEPSGDCLYGRSLATALDGRIRDLVGAQAHSALRQSISMIVPYAGQFCLDSLSTHGALLLIRNPTQTGFQVRLRRLDGSGREESVDLQPNSMMPIKVDRVAYVLEALPEGSGVVRERFDLNMAEAPVRPLALGGVNGDLTVDSRLLQESSEWAQRAGLPPKVYEDLSLKAVGLLKRARQEVQAQSLVKAIVSRGVRDRTVNFVLSLAQQLKAVEVRQRAVDQGLDINDVAIALGHAGKFATSAQLCQEQLAATTIQGNAPLFECAYLGWTAAGEEMKAIAVAKTPEAGNAFVYCENCMKAAKGGGGASIGARLVMDKVRQ